MESGRAQPVMMKNGRLQWFAVALVIAAVVLIAGIRWRVRDMPLERDEGEYAYAGQLMLQGIPPYQQAYNMKLPGTYAAYAAILWAFGETPAGIHTGLLLVNACTTVLVFLAGRKLYGDWAGAAAGATYALLSSSESVMGLSGHATHFVVLMAMAGVVALLLARESKSVWAYLVAGLCMGLAFVMKQPGLVFAVFGALEVLRQSWQEKASKERLAAKLAAYAVGVVTPYLLTCLLLYRAGVFGRFWFWTVQYARQYGTETGFEDGMGYLKTAATAIFLAAPIVWLFALVGVAVVVCGRRMGGVFGTEGNLLLWSFVGVSFGLFYRLHYFILLLPAASLLAGRAVTWCFEEAKTRRDLSKLAFLPVAIFVAGYSAAVYGQRADLFQRSPTEVVRARYGGNPFPESMEFGRYIREHSDASARVAVLGSEPEIYFYSRRQSATGYIYMYGLMEEQPYAAQMQEEMQRQVEQAKPEYMVKVMVRQSWLRKPHSDTSILEWGERYLAEEYEMVGAADISKEGTTYQWGSDAQRYVPKSQYSMYLYKRKS